MGINSLTHRDDGYRVAVPVSTDDWQQWVSAGRTRNWMLDDPLIDDTPPMEGLEYAQWLGEPRR